MNKIYLVRLVVLLLLTATMSGCIWFVEDEGFGHGGGHGYHGGRHGGHH